jgi:DNA-binding NarL/FixJ family response regulator
MCAERRSEEEAVDLHALLEDALRRQRLALEFMQAANEQLDAAVQRMGPPAARPAGPDRESAQLARREPVAALTSRQREVVYLIASGLTNRQIADHLGISEKTVKNHVSGILARLHLPARTAVAVHAVVTGMVDRRP